MTTFEFSRDGQSIAFLRPDEKTEEEKQAEKEKRSVVLVDQDHNPSHIYLIDLIDVAATSGETVPSHRLTSGTDHFTALDWAPDGSWLAVRHQSDPTINTGTTGGDVSRLEVPARSEDSDEAALGVLSGSRRAPWGRKTLLMSLPTARA